ncbi:hypothetical protein D9757_015341 [Collybiopsis confluens]|uniref:Ubiquitin-like protease family profile domain-containing protein n=1 Tax=Collybiopsis confluens TaxID=2823264 RepID=A0A8H5CM05_9AGAR|nr:hypothetical protein D9757_015341 [Collybiopsis confluens]
METVLADGGDWGDHYDAEPVDCGAAVDEDFLQDVEQELGEDEDEDEEEEEEEEEDNEYGDGAGAENGTRESTPVVDQMNVDPFINYANTDEARLENLVESAVREVGWIPREVYLYMAEGQADLGKAIIKEYLSQQTSLVDQVNFAPRTTLLYNISHKIFHQHLIVRARNIIRHAEFAVSFKSFLIHEEFTKQLRARNWKSLMKLLEATQDATDPTSRILAGNVFEAIVHKSLPNLSTDLIFVPMTPSEAEGEHVSEEDNIKGEEAKKGGSEKKQKDKEGTKQKDEREKKPKEQKEEAKEKRLPLFAYKVVAEDKRLPIDFKAGRRRMHKFTPPISVGINPNAYYQGSRTTPLIDAFILLTDKSVAQEVLYFFQYTISKKKDSGSLKGYNMVTDIYYHLRRKYPLLVVRFVLLQPYSSDNTVWRLPDFDFEYSVYYTGFPIDPVDIFYMFVMLVGSMTRPIFPFVPVFTNDVNKRWNSKDFSRRLHSFRNRLLNAKRPQHRCKEADCPPFGPTQTCKAIYISQLSHLVNQCHLILPFLNLGGLLTLASVEEFNAVMEQHFSTTGSAPADTFYINTETHIKSLLDLSKKLSSSVTLYRRFTACLQLHEYSPSDGLALVAFENIQLFLECANAKRALLERTLWKAFDDYPDKTTERLRSVMFKITSEGDPFSGKIPFMATTDFCTLGVGRWLNDEIVNYFIEKWCTQSGTLGLSTFFANSHLFQASELHLCVNAKIGTLTAEDERRVLRWCSKAVKKQNLIGNWDSVFIPINEQSTHWYSAYIDFRLRRIEVFDSLEINCTSNRKKPVTHQKNMQLMLVLMWLAEVLGRMRGEPVFLKNDPETEWICEPHSTLYGA